MREFRKRRTKVSVAEGEFGQEIKKCLSWERKFAENPKTFLDWRLILR